MACYGVNFTFFTWCFSVLPLKFNRVPQMPLAVFKKRYLVRTVVKSGHNLVAFYTTNRSKRNLKLFLVINSWKRKATAEKHKNRQQDMCVYFNSTQVSILNISSYLTALQLNTIRRNGFSHPETIPRTLRPLKPQLYVSFTVLLPPRPALTNTILPLGSLRRTLISFC